LYTPNGRLPWETSGQTGFEEDVWELYNIAEDFSQAVDLAEKEPALLRKLQDLFMADAAKYNVLPLDDRFAERLDTTLQPNFFAGRNRITFYPGLVRLPEGGAEGVIIALGGEAAGWSLFLWEGKARYHYGLRVGRLRRICRDWALSIHR
jgi:arylsulfatase